MQNTRKPPGGDPIDAFVSELREVTHSITEGKSSEILGAILAQDAIRLCESCKRRVCGEIGPVAISAS